MGDANMPPSRYIATLDIGTTTLRCHVWDHNCKLKGSSSSKTTLLYPQTGFVEIDENYLYKEVITVIKSAITASSLTAKDITCLGITTQRNTFITWDRETGKPFHHFISWQDLRAADYVESWNNSYFLRTFNNGSKFLHALTRKKRFLAGSVLKFSSAQVTMKLLYQLDHDLHLRQRAEDGHVMFGTIECWLIWKLTRGQYFVTDYSCASSTGLYDPFNMQWSSVLCNFLGIPINIFPKLVDTSGVICSTSTDIFGAPIRISSVVADQQAAMFGEGCFDIGDVKCTMGTGTFVDLNTGSKPHASIAGLYPLVGWKIGSEVVYLAEGLVNDTATCIEWAHSLGLFSDVSESSDIAQNVKSSDGVYFVPAFSGLQAPINDDQASCLLIGLKPYTSKSHILRAILESVAFRFKLLYETVLNETKIPLSYIRADGGVSNNDFVLQLMSNLVNQTINRPKQMDMSSVGAAYLAGLAVGIWKDKNQLKKLRKTDRHFKPESGEWERYRTIITEWERAVKRSMNWYRYNKEKQT